MKPDPCALAKLLAQLEAALRIDLFEYEGFKAVKSGGAVFSTGGRKVVKLGEGKIALSLTVEPVAGDETALDLRVTWQGVVGSYASVGGVVTLEFARWSKANYVFLPGAVYAGNRFESRRLDYPPLVQDAAALGVHPPLVISDVPRLNIREGRSRLQLRSGDLTTPAMGCHDAGRGVGMLLLATQGTSVGQNGFEVRENETRDRAVFSVQSPGVREDFAYFIGNTEFRPSQDRGVRFEPKNVINLRLRLQVFPADDLAGFFEKFHEIRRAVEPAGEHRAQLPFSEAWRILEKKTNDEDWVGREGIYAVAPVTPEGNYTWQMGWVGGLMRTLPLLQLGDAVSRQRAQSNFDWLCRKGVSPSGFFETMWVNDHWEDDSFGKNPLPGTRWLLVRKNADGLYFMLRHLEWWQKNEPAAAMPALWNGAVRGCVEAFVRLWKRYGQFGQFVDMNTGDILVGGSASAGIAPAALALAGRLFDEPDWLAVAAESALACHERFVATGLTTGGPGEILQSPDSESAFGLVEAMVVLYEESGDRAWLPRALEAARLAATWVMSYDFRFPSASAFGSLDMTTTGTVFANAQNKHSAPGICTLSGDSLFKLYRATGDESMLTLCRDIARALPQYLSRADRPIPNREGNLHPGWICERVNTSDWLEPVGEVFFGSCWCEVSLMLTCAQLPGVYARPDTGLLACFDHVEARWLPAAGLGEGEGGALIELTNPTVYDAHVRLLVETAEDQSRPLRGEFLGRAKLVKVPAGATCVVTLSEVHVSQHMVQPV